MDGIKVKIYSGDHGNPHVHGVYQGSQVKIYIKTLDVETGGLPPKQMRKLKEWISDNEPALLERWNEIIGTP